MIPIAPADAANAVITSVSETQAILKATRDSSTLRTSDDSPSAAMAPESEASENEAVSAVKENKTVGTAEDHSISDAEAAKTAMPPADKAEAVEQSSAPEDHTTSLASAEAASAPPNPVIQFEGVEHAEVTEDRVSSTASTDAANAKDTSVIEVISAESVNSTTDRAPATPPTAEEVSAPKPVVTTEDHTITAEPEQETNFSETAGTIVKSSGDNATSTIKASDHTATPPLALKTSEDIVNHDVSSTSAPAESTAVTSPLTSPARPRMRPGQQRKPWRDSRISTPTASTAASISTSPTSDTGLSDKLMNQSVQPVTESDAPIVKTPGPAPLTTEERLRKLNEEIDRIEHEELAAARAAATPRTEAANAPAVADEAAAASDASPSAVSQGVGAVADTAADPTQSHVRSIEKDEGLAAKTAWHQVADDWSELDDELFGESPAEETFPEV